MGGALAHNLHVVVPGNWIWIQANGVLFQNIFSDF